MRVVHLREGAPSSRVNGASLRLCAIGIRPNRFKNAHSRANHVAKPNIRLQGHSQDFLSLLGDRHGHRNVDISTSGTRAHFWPLMSTVLNAAFLAVSKIMPALPVAKRTQPSSLRSIRCSPPWSQMNCMQLRGPASGSSSSPWKASHSTTESRLISGLYL